MPNPTFPATLPLPQADTTAAYDAAENAVRTSMESGVAKQRRRFTNVASPFKCTLKLTQAQVATLDDFVINTLQGVLPFDWVDFRTGAAATYRFTGKRPAYSYIQGQVNRWLATLELERMP